MTEIALTDFQTIMAEINTLGMAVLTFDEFMATAAAATASGVSYSTTTPAPDTVAGGAGSATTVARSDHSHPRPQFSAADHGLIAWPYDPSLAASSSVLATAGTVYVIKMHLAAAASITNIVTQVNTAGATLTAGQCFAGVYQGGTLLGTTADQAPGWASTGVKTMPLAGGPFAAAAGDVYVAFFFNGTTGPTLPRSNGNALINVGLAASGARYATADTARTTSLPGTLGTLTALSVSYWAGLS